MYQIIAPSLFQNKVCVLPGIGTLLMVSHPAETDFIHSRISAPFETIYFTLPAQDENLFNEFSAISELLLKELNENGSVELPGVGTFTKIVGAGVQFSAITIEPFYNQPIEVERVIRQDASHAILVGDQQTTSVKMSGFFNNQTTPSDWWWIWAVVLAVIGIGALLFYFYLGGTAFLGNSNHY